MWKVVSAFLILTSCIPAARRLPGALPEVSGVALLNGRLILINDGGNPAVIYHLRDSDARGSRFALDTFATPVRNHDWESIAAADGTAYTVCDIGDNAARRDSVSFHRFEGTKYLGSTAAAYEGGARNAEACFHESGELFVIEKAEVGTRGLRPARLYRLVGHRLVLTGSLGLPRRSVTGAYVDSAGALHLVAYDYGFTLGLPYTRTSVFTVELERDAEQRVVGFRQNTLRERRVRAPFTLTQYEAIAPGLNNSDLIFSEKTLWIAPRMRSVSLEKMRAVD